MSVTKSVLPTCSHVRANGQICQALAVKESRFCYFHSRAWQRRRILRDVLAVRRDDLTDRGRHKPPATFDDHAATLFEHLDIPIVEDATSAVVAVNAILQALATRQISANHANSMYRGVNLCYKFEAKFDAEQREPKHRPQQSVMKNEPPLYHPFVPNLTMDNVTGPVLPESEKSMEQRLEEWKASRPGFVPLPDVRDELAHRSSDPGTPPNEGVAHPDPAKREKGGDSAHEPEGRLKVAHHEASAPKANERNGGFAEKRKPGPVGTADLSADSTQPEAFKAQASQTPKEISPVREGGVGGLIEGSSPLQRAAQDFELPPKNTAEPAQPRTSPPPRASAMGTPDAVPHDSSVPPCLRGETVLSRNEKPGTRILQGVRMKKVASTGRIDLYEAEAHSGPSLRSG